MMYPEFIFMWTSRPTFYYSGLRTFLVPVGGGVVWTRTRTIETSRRFCYLSSRDIEQQRCGFDPIQLPSSTIGDHETLVLI